MTSTEYRATLAKLKLNQREAAEKLHVSLRTSTGYANGEPIPERVAAHLALLVSALEKETRS